MFRTLAVSIAILAGVTANAADPAADYVRPQEIGSRTVVLDFTVDENEKAAVIDLVSTEAAGLNPWAQAMVKSGHVKPNSPGVIKLADGKYRATISFPLAGDGSPLPPGITPPKMRLQPGPQYPYELARADTPGGALLRLTINEKAAITKTEIVRASHKEFGSAAVDAVKKWRLAEPAKQDGAPIAVTLFQLITFEIEGKPPALWEWQMCPEPALPPFTVSGSYIPVTPELIKKLKKETRK